MHHDGRSRASNATLAASLLRVLCCLLVLQVSESTQPEPLQPPVGLPASLGHWQVRAVWVFRR